MALIQDADRKLIAERFAEMTHSVTMHMFTQELECRWCEVTHDIVQELATLSPKVKTEIHDFLGDPEAVKKYGIDKIPAIAIVGAQDYRIRFYGVPAGYEFTPLLEAIFDVGRGDAELPEALQAEVAKIDQPVHLQVMVTPTCPYCGRAVRAAHRFAMANPMVRGDMVEISEFPHLAVRYAVQGVPQTIINESVALVGAQPEMNIVKEILKTIGK